MANEAEELIQEMPTGLVRWYPFTVGARVLYLGTEDALAEALADSQLQVTRCTVTDFLQGTAGVSAAAPFDDIMLVGDLELEQEPKRLLQACRQYLRPEGHLLLGLHNRLGIRYFCGDADPYTGRSFDGVEDYRRVYGRREDVFRGRAYSRQQIEQMLEDCGWTQHKFYAVYPDLANPFLLYADDCLPNEDIANRITPVYEHPEMVFLEENRLYDQLVQEGLFHRLANAFFVDCTVAGTLPDIRQVTSFLERGREASVLTLQHGNGTVEKRAVYPEGRARIHRLAANMADLQAHGLRMVPGQLVGDAYVMPFVTAENGQLYFERLAAEDPEACWQALDHFRDLILQSSEHVRVDAQDGVILRRGYWDLVPWNSFFQDGDFVFYDQEGCVDNFPANVLIFRMLHVFSSGRLATSQVPAWRKLLARYGLQEREQHWAQMEQDLLSQLQSKVPLAAYHAAHRAQPETLYANRQRMQYSTSDYQRLFVDIFAHMEHKQLILFGSGSFTRKFLEIYGQDYPIAFIVDNQRSRWGQTLGGLSIESPERLRTLTRGAYRVLICIKDYVSVMQQLREMGIYDFAVFDAYKDYPRRVQSASAAPASTTEGEAKKYHIGYVAGVFDLFHVGHLRLLQRAKALCDYLIVGAVSDEGVRRLKGRLPVIPCTERVEVLRGCRYVDQAEALPVDYGGIRDAWRMFHFDVQFSGDDHAENLDWSQEREFLRQHGADIVYFPYTEETSSTQIKVQIEERLGKDARKR